ncbi:MAG: hypothetical protein J5778_07190 [Clostridiales bacterium]|nr:hypothetical protein [Clostridiales bacterium]
MVKIIAGAKGSGKTARLVDEINQVAMTDSNVVCVERGNRLDQLLKHSVRLINVKEYPVAGFDQLLAFIGGICSKDYDLTHIYIDSIAKVACNEDIEALTQFIKNLDGFLKDSAITATLVLSLSVDELPEDIKGFVEA